MKYALPCLDNENIPYLFRDSKKAKRIRLCMTAQGLEVVLPKRWSARDLINFVQSEIDWIKKQYTKHVQVLLQIHSEENLFSWPAKFTNAMTLPLAGERVGVDIIYDEHFVFLNKRKCHIWSFNEQEHRIQLMVPSVNYLRENEKRLWETLLQWYFDEALAFANVIFAKWVPIMQAPLTHVSIKYQKRLWGSCSHSTGRIRLNGLLVLMPPAVFEYVIIHELCHLFEPNHSNKFWALVEKYCPDFRTSEKWLKEHSKMISKPHVT